MWVEAKGISVDALTAAGYTNVFGIDPNRTQVTVAQERGTDMVAGSTLEAPVLFKEHATKNATLFHVIEHLPDPQKDLKQIYDALPEGGSLIIETPNFGAPTFRRLNFQDKLVYPEHLFYYTPKTLKILLENAGFTIVSVTKRDFDQYHMNLHEALFRLGVAKKRGKQQRGFQEKTSNVTSQNNKDVSSGYGSVSTSLRHQIRDVLARALSMLVILTGQQNFMLVIARK
jgi:SAM-dependent methyltransferase